MGNSETCAGICRLSTRPHINKSMVEIPPNQHLDCYNPRQVELVAGTAIHKSLVRWIVMASLTIYYVSALSFAAAPTLLRFE
jgi:hypothetical protein